MTDPAAADLAAPRDESAPVPVMPVSATPAEPRTWLVECYAPGLVTTTVADDGDRIRAAVEVVRATHGPIEYLGALLVAGDEAVFHAFRAGTAALVEVTSRRARLRHTRIVESVAVAAPGLADALTRLLDATAGAQEPAT